MADIVPIVSVSASAVVAIATPLIAARLEHARLRRSQALEESGELRELLIEGAHRLTECWHAMHDAARAMGWTDRSLLRGGSPSDPQEALVFFKDRLQYAYKHEINLRIRLGADHPVVAAYDPASKILLKGQWVLAAVAASGSWSDREEERFRKLRAEYMDVVEPRYFEAAFEALREHRRVA